jgi:hypothetical protein
MNRPLLAGKCDPIARKINGLLEKGMSVSKLVKDINVRLSDTLN